MQGQKPPLSFCSPGGGCGGTHPAQARPWLKKHGQGWRKRQSSGERARARCSTPHPNPHWVGGCLAAELRPGRRARDWEEPQKLEGCGRRVRAPAAQLLRARAPFPAPSPRPRSLSSLLSAPRLPSPRNQCSCRLSGCGFLQSLPRPPLRPERARSPAQQRPPVPSCEPRPQPPPALRSRLPGPPARPPRSGRRTGPRRPHPTPGGRSRAEAGGCQLTRGCLRAGGRAEEGRGPGRMTPLLPCTSEAVGAGSRPSGRSGLRSEDACPRTPWVLSVWWVPSGGSPGALSRLCV